MARVPVSQRTIDWLLSEENPPVRYLTLTRLLDRSGSSREVRGAKARLGDYGPTKKILAQRKKIWRVGADVHAKYRGGYWQLIFLGEFLAPRSPGVEEGVELALEHRVQVGDGLAWLTAKDDEPWWGVHCMNANLLRAMVALGFGRDRRVRAGLEHVAQDVVRAKGIPCYVIELGLLDLCHMSLPKVLLALTSLPAEQRTPAMRRAAKICRERLLEREVCNYVPRFTREWFAHLQASPDLPSSVTTKPERRAKLLAGKRKFLTKKGGLGERKEKQGWRRFGFPLHYNSDNLEALRALVQAKTPKRSPGVEFALERVLERRGSDGRWKMEHSWNGKMIANVETKGRPSRWITFYALHVLRWFRGLEPGVS
ncbi:MAG: hypothetical protein O7B99_08415 [Planctomycetota bacterium]|nr:hypothetical protein [Planctomycetota bacterium]